MFFKQERDISSLKGGPLKLENKFMYLGSSISSTESDINMRLTIPWNPIDRLSIIWKSDLSDKIKRNFFQTVVVSILLYRCTTENVCPELKKNAMSYIEQILEVTVNETADRRLPTSYH